MVNKTLFIPAPTLSIHLSIQKFFVICKKSQHWSAKISRAVRCFKCRIILKRFFFFFFIVSPVTDSSSLPTQRASWRMNPAAVIRPSCPICHLFISPRVPPFSASSGPIHPLIYLSLFRSSSLRGPSCLSVYLSFCLSAALLNKCIRLEVRADPGGHSAPYGPTTAVRLC